MDGEGEQVRRGTPEYNEARKEQIRRADIQLAQAFTRFTLEELAKDWRCNLLPRQREILSAEYARRGIQPPVIEVGK